MFWKSRKPSQAPALPTGIESEINLLAAKLDTEPKPKKPSVWPKALRNFREKLRGEYNRHQRVIYTSPWQNSIARWQLAFSFIGLLAASLVTQYMWTRPVMTAIWFVACLAPSGITLLAKRVRASFWISTVVGSSGFLLFFLTPPLRWYGPIIQLVIPIAHFGARILKEKAIIRNEEIAAAEREVADPTKQLAMIIEKHRQKVAGANSELGIHLAQLESKLSQVRLDRTHWERRARQQPDSQLFAKRLSEARAMEKRLDDSCDTLFLKKREILAGLDELEGRIPIIDSEIEDWRQDRAHQELMDEAGILADETEVVIRRTIQAFSSDIQAIAGKIEGMRIQIAGGVCEPKLIGATEQTISSILADTEQIIAAPTTSAAANLS